MNIMYEDVGITGKIGKLLRKKMEILEPTHSVTIEKIKYLKLEKKHIIENMVGENSKTLVWKRQKKSLGYLRSIQ